jgi:hypothetical protein
MSAIVMRPAEIVVLKDDTRTPAAPLIGFSANPGATL